MRRIAMVVTTVLVVSPGLLSAQSSRRLQPGADVRITYPCATDRFGCREKGRIVWMTADSIGYRVVGETREIPTTEVTRVEVKTGRMVSPARLLGYPVLGLVAGGLVGGLIGYTSCAPCDYELEGLAVVGMAGIVGGLGFATGLVLGLLPRDRWEDAPVGRVNLDVSPSRDGGVRFGVSLRF